MMDLHLRQNKIVLNVSGRATKVDIGHSRAGCSRQSDIISVLYSNGKYTCEQIGETMRTIAEQENIPERIKHPHLGTWLQHSYSFKTDVSKFGCLVTNRRLTFS